MSSPKVDDRRRLGAFGEAAVARQYEQSGAVVLDRNWRVREGEIDLVVSKGGCLKIVEVKTRRSTRFGIPAEAITYAKAARLRRLAGLWVGAHPKTRFVTWKIEIASVMVGLSGAADIEIISLED